MSTLIYPQLTQFPVIKTRRARTVLNQAADGSTVRLADAPGEVTQWRLEYAELTDDEAASLEQFFLAAEGSLNSFTFLDPMANLLASSESLEAAVWQKGPLLQVSAGHVANAGTGPQSIAQTIAAPGGYLYCFSVSVKAATPVTVRLLMGSQAGERAVTSDWSRLAMAANPDAARFGIEIPAGTAVDIAAPQVEAQGGPSSYRASSRGGVYTEARLKDDVLQVTRTGFNRNSCTVNIIHANHL